MMPAEIRRLKKTFRDGFESLSIYLERRLIIVFLMGFASGLPFLLSTGHDYLIYIIISLLAIYLLIRYCFGHLR